MSAADNIQYTIKMPMKFCKTSCFIKVSPPEIWMLVSAATYLQLAVNNITTIDNRRVKVSADRHVLQGEETDIQYPSSPNIVFREI